MKTKILVLMLALCLILCACGGTESQDDSKTTTTQAPDAQVTTTNPASAGDILTTEPTLDWPNLFPEDFEGVELPAVSFDEDDENGILTSRPVSEVTDPPVQEEPEETEETDPPVQHPSTAYTKGDLLPEDPFFDPES